MKKYLVSNHFLIVILLIIIASFLRMAYLTDIPFRLDGDAGKIALDSVSVWQYKQPVFSTGWSGYNNLFFYINGIFLFIFGQGILGMRILAAFGGVLSVIFVYFVGSELFNKRVGLLSLFIVTFLPIHLEFSRKGIDHIHPSWLLLLILLFTIKSIRKNSFIYIILTGFFLGFSQYFYHAARMIPIVFIFSYFILTYKKWPLKKILFNFLFIVFIAILVYFPMLLYYQSNPTELLSRIRQVDAFQFSIESNGIDKNLDWGFIKKQLNDPIFVFFHLGKAHPMHSNMQYFTNLFESTLFTLGLILLFMRIKKSSSIILLFWFVSGVVLGGILTIDSPQAGRYVILIPVICIIMALAIDWLLYMVRKKYVLKYIIFSALCFNSIYNVYLYLKYEYFEAFQFDVNTQIASYAGRYLEKNRKDSKIYFLGDNNMYYNAIPTLPFLTRKEGVDTNSSVTENENLLSSNSVYIILSSRESDKEVLDRFFPNARKLEFRNPLGQLLFWLYET